MKKKRTDWQTPFYANIFSYIPSTTREGYAEMDEATLLEVDTIPGFLGYEVTGTETRRIFISYWESPEAIDLWRKNTIHKQAKSKGKIWYAAFHSMVCKIEHHSLWHTELL